MNNGIKHSGLVLATGVVLGWASSVAVATDVIGVGDYGGFFRCDAVVRNGDNTVSILRASDALNFDYGTEGSVTTVDVLDGGLGYQDSGSLSFDGGTPLFPAGGTYEIDGIPGTYQAELVTVVSGGTGYTTQTPGDADQIYTGLLVDSEGDPIDCTVTDWAAGGAEVADGKGLILNPNSNVTGGVDAGDIGNITINGGLGYGNCDGCEFEVTIAGATPDPAQCRVFYDTIGGAGGDGTIEIDWLSSTFPDDVYLAPPTITLTPAAQDNNGGDADPTTWNDVNGAGFSVTDVTLWGSVSAVDPANVVIGEGCADDAVDVQVSVTGKGVELPALEVQLATWSVGDQGTGTVLSASISSPGEGYSSVPTVTGSTDAGATQAASFVARLGAPGGLITLADGTSPTIGPDLDVFTGGDFDGNGLTDLLLHNRTYGGVVVWNQLSSGLWRVDVVGLADGGWKIIGLVEDTAADGGGVIIWRNQTTGLVAGWLLNTAESTPALNFFTDESSGFIRVSLDWVAACTNNSLGTGDNLYWYNQNTGRSAVWNLEVDSSTSTFKVNSNTFLTYGSTGTVALASESWEIVGVAAASGVDATLTDQIACDVVWRNTADGRVGLWECNPTANSQVDDLEYLKLSSSEGALMTPAPDFKLVGIGQYEVQNAQYGTAPLGPLRKNYWGTTLVWNKNGRSAIWGMSTLLEQETWTFTGPAADSGTGNIRSPNVVFDYSSY